METEVKNIIQIVENITQNYEEDNIYKKQFIDNENVIYFSVSLFGDDGKRHLSFYIEYYKKSNTLMPIICNTQRYTLHETVNIESVKIALNVLLNHL